MFTFMYLTVAAILVAAIYVVLKAAAGAYFRFRGTRLITCPETKRPAAVCVDAKHSAITAPFGKTDLRLSDCSRWPERRGCGQECLGQIALAPEECLVRTILIRWYRDKLCVFCRKPLDDVPWLEHKPGLLSPDGKTVEWHEVRPETLPEVLATHWPVCWNCHIAETFRHAFPELVVDRPRQDQGS
jgi:hypothetical protein